MPNSTKKYSFTAVLEKVDKYPNAAYVSVPFNMKEIFNTRGQVKVKAAIDGIFYRGSLAPTGDGNHILGIRKEIRESLGKVHGDTVEVVFELDIEPREVELPDDFKLALSKNKKAMGKFEKLPYTHRKEYVEAIKKAKKEETRKSRIEKTILKLAE
jgi:hypothetical protein